MQVVGLTWGVFSAEVVGLPPAVAVLGADCLYDTDGAASALAMHKHHTAGSPLRPSHNRPADFDALFATVVYLLQKSPQASFITAYKNRRCVCVHGAVL